MNEASERERVSITSKEDIEITDRLGKVFGLSRPATMALALRVLDSLGHYGVTALIVRARDAAIAKVAEGEMAAGAKWVREQVADDLVRIERRLVELEDRCGKIR